jgi:hypothetical protein
MGRNLSARQLLFAHLAADGKHSLVAAFREVYQPATPQARHVYRNCYRLSRHPAVSAKIRELQSQTLPPLEDSETILRHAVGVVARLSTDSASEHVRLKAAELLYAFADRMQVAHEAEPRETMRAFVELRRLYKQLTEMGDLEDMWRT